MTRRTTSLTPLSLAVLELLHERPMHPYEVRHHVMDRGLDGVIKLNPGALYATVERLARAGLVEPVETSREGRRPERTVYQITEEGSEEFFAGLREVLCRPVKEYPLFAAGLAFIAALPPNDATRLLEWRALQLEAEIAATDAMLPGVERAGIPRLFMVEAEYVQAMRRAELNVVKGLVADIKSGALPWPDEALQLLERNASARQNDDQAKERESADPGTAAD